MQGFDDVISKLPSFSLEEAQHWDLSSTLVSLLVSKLIFAVINSLDDLSDLPRPTGELLLDVSVLISAHGFEKLCMDG